MRKSTVSSFILLSLSLFAFSSIYFTSFVNSEIAEGSVQTGGSRTDGSWSMFGHDPCNTRFSPSSVPQTPIFYWAVGIPCLESSPAVVDGRVFIGSGTAGDKSVHCLNETDGTSIWSYRTNDKITSSPAVVEGKVFIGSEDGDVYCLNATDGVLVWKYMTDGTVHFSSPMVVNGRLFIGISWLYDSEGYLYCLNATNGACIWNYTAHQNVYSSPATINGKVFVGGTGPAGGKVYCLNETTGENIWTYTTGDHVGPSSPAVADGKVFIGSFDERVYCLNETDGRQIWCKTASSRIHSSPAVANGRVFIASEDGDIYCLNETTGTCMWTYKTVPELLSSPTIADGMVLINPGGHGNGIIALNETTGTLIWEYTLSGRFGKTCSSPAVANGKIYAGFWDGGILCIGPSPVLTVYANGVSSHSPVAVTLDGAGVGTVCDDHPLEIVLDADKVPIAATISVNNTHLWSINPQSRYSFTKWTGPATGTNTSNPITIALSADSSCTANYRTQHLTNIMFKDNGGTISIEPTQIAASAPNGSLVTLSSSLKQWLDDGTWTLKQVIWRGNNVKPSIDSAYASIPGGTWTINCRVYLISFLDSFKDTDGNALYTLPSSFKLVFPNGTTSASLNPNLSYYVQNGTTTWSTIVWQGTEVCPPSIGFDPTEGNPTANCSVYSLTVDPIFYDNIGDAIIHPSSWSIEFPNSTTRTVSSCLTCNQTQTGNYSIVSLVWKGREVVPHTKPITSLTSDKSWSPSINCLLPPIITTSLSTSTSYVGFKAEISGNLTCHERSLSSAPILLSYSVTGGDSWNDISLVTTTSNGSYSAIWVPSATGNYLVRATWSGNATYPEATTTTSLAVLSFEGQNVFSVVSNSTISGFAFNTANRQLSFAVTGPDGTRGCTRVTIPKSLVVNIMNVRVLLDGTELECSVASTDDSWRLTTSYTHSTHEILVNLGPNAVPESSLFIILLVFAILTLLAAILYKSIRH